MSHLRASAVVRELRRQADPVRARHRLSFFRTGPGEYGESDRFLGLTVPQVRAVVKKSRSLPPSEIAKLISNPWHEVRLTGLLVAVDIAGRERRPAEIARWAKFYWRHRAGVNNWDLVDSSAPVLMGRWLLQLRETNPREVRRWLLRAAGSRDLWERRIAVLSTFAFIRAGIHDETLAICRALLCDEEDLIHKATGWMLREIDEREPRLVDGFLRRHAGAMPRTMLRYAIEKKNPSERRRWMAR